MISGRESRTHKLIFHLELPQNSRFVESLQDVEPCLVEAKLRSPPERDGLSPRGRDAETLYKALSSKPDTQMMSGTMLPSKTREKYDRI